ncbi:hypothetical protein [Actinomadura vinacea]|uniref:hypothetical protein n=1 Tax=Actinomadura vinacea TaxID=115336 RepID=UPI0031E1B13C
MRTRSSGRGRATIRPGEPSEPRAVGDSPSAGTPAQVHAPSRRSNASRFDMPTKSATYPVAGCSKTCFGVSNWSIVPPRMMASRSPSASASDWSWVTKTAVKRSFACSR